MKKAPFDHPGLCVSNGAMLNNHTAVADPTAPAKPRRLPSASAGRPPRPGGSGQELPQHTSVPLPPVIPTRRATGQHCLYDQINVAPMPGQTLQITSQGGGKLELERHKNKVVAVAQLRERTAPSTSSFW